MLEDLEGSAAEEDVKRELAEIYERAEHATSYYRPDGPWAKLEILCKKILREAGLPTEAGLYRQDEEGRWSRSERSDDICFAYVKLLADWNPAQLPRIEVDFYGLLEIALQRFGWGSPVYYAACVVSLADDLRIARRAGLPSVCEGFAFSLGVLTERRRIKLKQEKTWLSGRKAEEGGRKAAEERFGTKEQVHQRYAEIVRAFERHRAEGKSKGVAEKEAAKDCGVKPPTVRRARAVIKKINAQTSE